MNLSEQLKTVHARHVDVRDQAVNLESGLPMIQAEELDADWSLVRSRNGSNDPAYVDPLFGIHLTGGSHSVKNSFTQYRELGARARAMLLSAAAARWNVGVATLRTQAGTVLGPGLAGNGWTVDDNRWHRACASGSKAPAAGVTRWERSPVTFASRR
jgi:CO/xanthine dehydrogenase Mo-binding subunit